MSGECQGSFGSPDDYQCHQTIDNIDLKSMYVNIENVSRIAVYPT